MSPAKNERTKITKRTQESSSSRRTIGLHQMHSSEDEVIVATMRFSTWRRSRTRGQDSPWPAALGMRSIWPACPLDRVTILTLLMVVTLGSVASAAREEQAEASQAKAPASSRERVAADIVLEGGTLIDGTGAPARRADVAIRGDRIVAVGSFEVDPRARVIDARSMVVAPGFIDLHTHSDPGNQSAGDPVESQLPHSGRDHDRHRQLRR